MATTDILVSKVIWNKAVLEEVSLSKVMASNYFRGSPLCALQESQFAIISFTFQLTGAERFQLPRLFSFSYWIHLSTSQPVLHASLSWILKLQCNLFVFLGSIIECHGKRKQAMIWILLLSEYKMEENVWNLETLGIFYEYVRDESCFWNLMVENSRLKNWSLINWLQILGHVVLISAF